MFTGFTGGKSTLVKIPSVFFSDLLPQLTNIDDIRVALFVFFRFENMETPYCFVCIRDFEANGQFLRSFDQDPILALNKANRSLQNLVNVGMLVSASMSEDNQNEILFFLNSPKGKAARAALQEGKWSPGETLLTLPSLNQQDNVFLLYEQNIGPITPIISDALKDAEDTYPSPWIHAAFKLAVERNKRNWRYIHSILRRWKEVGFDERKNKRDSQENRRRYIEDDFPDSIDH